MGGQTWELSVEEDAVIVRSGEIEGARIDLGEFDLFRILHDLGWYMELRPECPQAPNSTRAELFEARLAGTREYLCEQLAPLSCDAQTPALLSIVAEEEVLRQFPWELCEQPGLYVRRHPHALPTVPSPQRREDTPLHVLVVAPRPQDALYFDHRPSTLNVIARAYEAGGKTVVEHLPSPTYHALRRRLEDPNEPPVDILHLDGHGRWRERCGRSFVVFEGEGEDAQSDLRDAEDLATLLPPGLSLLVLELCDSARASATLEQELVALDVPALLAFPWVVTPATTQRFFASFYASLFSGQTLAAATASARAEMREGPTQIRAPRDARVDFEQHDWFVPVLYQRGDDRPLCSEPCNPRDLPKILREVSPVRAYSLMEVERMLERTQVVALAGIIGEGKQALAFELARWLFVTRRVDAVVWLNPQDMNPERFEALLGEQHTRSRSAPPRTLFIVLDLQIHAIYGLELPTPGSEVMDELAHRLQSDPQTRLIVTGWHTELLMDLFLPWLERTPVLQLGPLERTDGIHMVQELAESPPELILCELIAELLAYHHASITTLAPALLAELAAHPEQDPRELLMHATWRPAPRLREALLWLMPQDLLDWGGEVLTDPAKRGSLAVHEHRGGPARLFGLRDDDPESIRMLHRDVLLLEQRGLAGPMLLSESLLSLSERPVEDINFSPGTTELLISFVRVHPGLTFHARAQLSAAERYHAARRLIYQAALGAQSLANSPILIPDMHTREFAEQVMREASRPNMRRALWCAAHYRRGDYLPAIYNAVDHYSRRSSPSFEQSLANERGWAAQLLERDSPRLAELPIAQWGPGAPEATLAWADDQLRRDCSAATIATVEALVVALERAVDEEPATREPLLAALSVLWMAYNMKGRLLDSLERQTQALRLVEELEASNPRYTADMRAQCLNCQIQILSMIDAPSALLEAQLAQAKYASANASPPQRLANQAQHGSVGLRHGLEQRPPIEAFGNARYISDNHMRANVNREYGSALLTQALSRDARPTRDRAERELTRSLADLIELEDRGSAGLSALGLARLARAEGRLLDNLFLIAWARQALAAGGRSYDQLRSLCLLASEMLDSIDSIPQAGREEALTSIRELLKEAVECARGQQHQHLSAPHRLLAELNHRSGLPRAAEREASRAEALDAHWRETLEAHTGIPE